MQKLESELRVKVAGDRAEVDLVIDCLEKDFFVRATSSFIKEESDEGGVHIYISLIPKSWGRP